MYFPSINEFLRLSRRSNLVPVYREISADLDTPVSSFLKINKGDYAFLLESVEGREKIARYSYLGAQPAVVFQSKGRNIQIYDANRKGIKRYVARGNPLDEIKQIMKDFRPVTIKGLPRFYGGMVGYLGYDMVRFFEEIPDKNPDDLNLPDAVFMLTDHILVFDHVNHSIKIVANVILPKEFNLLPSAKRKRFYYRAIRRIEAIHDGFKKPSCMASILLMAR